MKIGDKIGMFTLLEKKRENNRTYYFCKCECGNEKWIRSDCIGSTISCGCYNKIKDRKDITNKKYGRLVAIKSTEKVRDKSVVWEFKCECGNTVYYTVKEVKHKKSCGCLRKEKGTIKQKEIFKIYSEKNLKEGTSLDRISNNKLLKNNKSGIKGVHYDSKKCKWVAQITFKGKLHYLGRYNNIENAVKARKAAEEKYFKPIIKKYKKD